MESNNLFKRNLQVITEVTNPKLRFSIMQWNALASCCATTWKYPSVDSKYVDFNYRRELLKKEIASFNADIVCLEEVDQKDVEFFNSIFYEKEYHRFFSKKNFSEDGVCLFVRKTFEIVESEAFTHLKANDRDPDNQVSHAAILKYTSQNEDYYILVGVSHLQAFKFYGYIRKRQAAQLVAHLERKKQEYSKLLGGKQEKICTIVCGDLNDYPNSLPIQEFRSSKDLDLKSAFDDAKFTVYRIFPIIPKLFSIGIPYKGTVDFILHSGNLVVTKKAEDPTDEEVGNKGLPSSQYPSDHLSLFCEVAFK